MPWEVDGLPNGASELAQFLRHQEDDVAQTFRVIATTSCRLRIVCLHTVQRLKNGKRQRGLAVGIPETNCCGRRLCVTDELLEGDVDRCVARKEKYDRRAREPDLKRAH